MKLTFIYIPTQDRDASLAFYRDTLGLDEAWREEDGTVAFWTPDHSLQLMVSPDDIPTGPMYLVDSVEAWQAEHADLRPSIDAIPIPGGSIVGFATPEGGTFYVFDQED
jgi:catechol 2,3-dioxygenase-like lactoylglutathione lyase family enzyme